MDIDKVPEDLRTLYELSKDYAEKQLPGWSCTEQVYKLIERIATLQSRVQQQEDWIGQLSAEIVSIGLQMGVLAEGFALTGPQLLQVAADSKKAIESRVQELTKPEHIQVPKALLERICGMVYATRGVQADKGFITYTEYSKLVNLRHSGHDSIETVLTALAASRLEEKP